VATCKSCGEECERHSRPAHPAARDMPGQLKARARGKADDAGSVTTHLRRWVQQGHFGADPLRRVNQDNLRAAARPAGTADMHAESALRVIRLDHRSHLAWPHVEADGEVNHCCWGLGWPSPRVSADPGGAR